MSQVAKCFDCVYVPDVILQEVGETVESKAKDFGLIVVSSPLEVEREPGLSFQDSVCLDFVKRTKCSCITNDKKLRSCCKREGGTVIWGLEMIEIMVSRKLITKQVALKAAEKIRTENCNITEEIVVQFEHDINSF